MTGFGVNRRTLMVGSAMGVLAAPGLLRGGAALAAETPSAPQAGMVSAGQGVRRLKLGEFEITVINDGMRPSDKIAETFGTDQKPEDVAALLKENFLPEDKFVNGFSPVLINTGKERVLFDTGLGEMGKSFGAGRLIEGLAAAGYQPSDIDVVVLTHLHPDHFGGLMLSGAPAFPKARYVIGQVEYDFWTAPERAGTPAAGTQDMIKKAVVPLAEKATFIADGATVAPGISAMLAPGHTPGHMIFRVESGGRTVMLTADTANHYVASLQRPDWEVKFDADKALAAKSRKTVFDMIATDRLPFIGYHMPFPAVGYVEKQGPGYRFVPASYQLDI